MNTKKFGLSLAIASFLILVSTETVKAGTGKSLSWCSYLNINNDTGGHINRMPCIHTSGAAATYCFHFVLWQNGTTTEHNCETWLWNNLSGQDIERLNYIFGQWNKGEPETTPTTLKNKVTGDLVIIHDNETSYDLQQCEELGFVGAAGTIEPADICWLGDAAHSQ